MGPQDKDSLLDLTALNMAGRQRDLIEGLAALTCANQAALVNSRAGALDFGFALYKIGASQTLSRLISACRAFSGEDIELKLEWLLAVLKKKNKLADATLRRLSGLSATALAGDALLLNEVVAHGSADLLEPMVEFIPDELVRAAIRGIIARDRDAVLRTTQMWRSLDKPPLLLMFGLLGFQTDSLDAALRPISKVQADFPGHGDALFYRAFILDQSGQPDPSLETSQALAVAEWHAEFRGFLLPRRKWPTSLGNLRLGFKTSESLRTLAQNILRCVTA